MREKKEITMSEAKRIFEDIAEIAKEKDITLREAYAILCVREDCAGHIVLQDSE